MALDQILLHPIVLILMFMLQIRSKSNQYSAKLEDQMLISRFYYKKMII
jgi:hypothetical protein